MNLLRTGLAVLLGSALACAGCGGDSGSEGGERPEAKPERAEQPVAQPREKPARHDQVGRESKSSERPKAATPKSARAPGNSTGSRKPTPAEIQAAQENQGDPQKIRRSPREEELLRMGSERQGRSQTPRKLTPREERAFKIGSESDKYQNHP